MSPNNQPARRRTSLTERTSEEDAVMLEQLKKAAKDFPCNHAATKSLPSRPVRSAEVEALFDTWSKHTDASGDWRWNRDALKLLFDYIAQLEASQPVQSEGLREALEKIKVQADCQARVGNNTYFAKWLLEVIDATLAQGSAPVSGTAEEAADKICREIDYGSNVDEEKSRVAAIIQQAMDGARAEAINQAASVVENNSERYQSGSLGEGHSLAPRLEGSLTGLAYASAIRALSERPAADDKLREALEKVRNDCEFVLTHGDNLGRLNALTHIHRDVAAALAQPASGGGDES